MSSGEHYSRERIAGIFPYHKYMQLFQACPTHNSMIGSQYGDMLLLESVIAIISTNYYFMLVNEAIQCLLTPMPTVFSAGNFTTKEELSFSLSLRGRTRHTTLTLQSPPPVLIATDNLAVLLKPSQVPHYKTSRAASITVRCLAPFFRMQNTPTSQPSAAKQLQGYFSKYSTPSWS